MQLTRAADYAVRVMIYLAGQPAGSRSSLPALAEAAECPEHFLSKVLQTLTRAELITAHRGVKGGYELSQPAEHITILRVVEAIEGPIHLNLCLISRNSCNRSSWCPAHKVWSEAQNAMEKVLGKTNIGRLAREARCARQN